MNEEKAHEDQFLEKYFTHLADLYHDKCKDQTEKEKDSYHTKTFPLWGQFITNLTQLAVSERIYFELGCVPAKNRSFLRKDVPLKSNYESMRNDMRRLQETSKQADETKTLLNVTFLQGVIELLSLRINLIDVYGKLFQLSTKYNKQDYRNLVDELDEIDTIRYPTLRNSKHLTPINNLVSIETQMMNHLLRAVLKIQFLEFVGACTEMAQMDDKMRQWEDEQKPEAWRINLFLKPATNAALFKWIEKFHRAIACKFAVFFHQRFLTYNNAEELKQSLGKLPFDLFNKIHAFQKQTDAETISFVYSDITALKRVSKKSNESTDVEDILEPYLLLYTYPENSGNAFLERFTNLLVDKQTDLLNMDKTIHVFNPKDDGPNLWYVTVNIDPKFHFIFVFTNKKSEKDSAIDGLVSEIQQCFRFGATLSELKVAS